MSILSFLNISLETADKFYSWGWKASCIGAAITLIGIIFLMWGTRVRDHDFQSQMKNLEKEAANSRENVAQLTVQAETLKVKALKAEEEIAKAKAQAALANEKVETTKLKNKELEIQLEKLRFATADRFIPDFVKNALIGELQKYNDKNITIICVLADDESLNFSEKLHQLFIMSNWHSELVNRQDIMIPAPTGIEIISKGTGNKDIAEFIYNQFNQLGYLISVKSNNDIQKDIIIRVLAK